MLNENIRIMRRERGLSQEELAARLHVVRQTVSKWEQGLSVPDAELLIALAETLETPVSALLGETIQAEPSTADVETLAQQLAEINAQLAAQKDRNRRVLHGIFLALAALTAAGLAGLCFLRSPYLLWDFGDPETAVLGTAFHAFEWLFVRAAPVLLLAAAVGAYFTRRK